MLSKINPTQTSAWGKLTNHFEKMKDIQMKSLFQSDPQRFDHFSVRLNDILLESL